MDPYLYAPVVRSSYWADHLLRGCLDRRVRDRCELGETARGGELGDASCRGRSRHGPNLDPRGRSSGSDRSDFSALPRLIEIECLGEI